ncbi:peptidoglycan-binding protein [Dactylosporangium sp. CA-052675]|uniref:peptidoglycan-binding protein n=1 Tax=Dactylosporangium sp. CA-052675 TaxID=3239927 RepID=UPI003D8A0D84
MAKWKPLPDGLDPQIQQLVVRLRELKDQAGISTATLARKTAYSRSSWERYLNAAVLPPRQAVEALGQLSGADPTRLLALWELAEHAQEEAEHPQEEHDPAHGAAPAASGVPTAAPRWRRPRIVAAAAGITVVAAVGVTVWLRVGHQSPSPQPSPVAQPTSYACDYATRDGRLYAGHSTTSDRLVALNGGSQDVVEVQCLLKHRGLDPGRIDGLFGKGTEQAVTQLQSANGLVADGIVGPQTWALLRT